MRKIVSKESEAKRRKRNQIIVGVILIFVMFGSVFGIVINNFGGDENSENKIIYNGIEFFKNNNYWFATIGEFDFIFRYNPEEVVSIKGEVDKLNVYSGQVVYIYSEDETSEIEIYRNFQEIAQRMQKACIEGLECPDENLPVKTCDDKFIIIQESNVADIVQNKSCVYIQGESKELTKITDEFLFKTIGIKD